MKNVEKDFIKFINDERFIEWVLFPTDETDNYWDLYLKNNPSDLEAFKLAKERFSNVNISSYNLSDSEINDEVKQIEISVRKHNRRLKLKFTSYVIAACFIAFAFLLIYNHLNRDVIKDDFIVGSQLNSEDIQLIVGDKTRSFQENINIEIDQEGNAKVESEGQSRENIATDQKAMNKLIVPYGKRSTLTLADGSKVWLNSGTVLEFPSQFENHSRNITLVSGEIYIDVAPDNRKSFYVNSSDLSVMVHGTEFNFSAYNDMAHSVVLVDGSVGLKSIGEKEQLLKPNQQAKLNSDGSFSINEVDINEFISWKNGYLIFDETPMSEVLKKIKRYYNISFNYDKDVSISEMTCVGRIVLSEDIDDVMTTIALITASEYKRENNKIYISNISN